MSESPDVVVARLAAVAPDAGGVVELDQAVRAGLSADGAWEAVAVLERQIAWLQAQQAKALAQAASVVPVLGRAEGHDWAQEELAAMLAISAHAAATRLETARWLTDHPASTALLERGEIGVPHVRVLVEETTGLGEARTAAVEAAVLAAPPTGHRWNWPNTSSPATADCVWPGCAQPARRTELDHRQRWSDGGHTTATNLQCLCAKHHHFKEAGWQSRLHPDGTIHWTSPTGRTYTRPPATYPPDHTGTAA